MTFLTERQREQISPAENVLWCGRARPTPFYRGWILNVAMGLMWGTSLYFFGPFKHVFSHRNRLDLFDLVLLCVGGLFSLIAVAQILSPLAFWVKSSRTVWAVTTQRVIRFCGPFVRSWPQCDLLAPVRIEERSNGCRDFVFCRKVARTSKGKHIRHWSIDNVPSEEVPALEAVFRRLTEKILLERQRHPNRLNRMIDEFYHPTPSDERDVGEYY